jgi:uncharacterized repeat protein (TIGR01451 family)
MKTCTRSILVSPIPVLLLALSCLPAWAKPQVEVSITANKVIQETVNGSKISKSVPAQSAEPGDTLTFIVTYKNIGTETAHNAIINNPISAGMRYIDNSATGEDSDISFSIDGGKNFKKPSYLTYEVKLPTGTTEKHTARPEEYTDIRWIVKKVSPGESGVLSYKARVK